ncbi:MAG: hypothetical protein HQL38_05495 [Alphaproteobacteria bacterium]|nr:hypothetical protein [Alphaproteobacteria bacterium]MBF0392115.1 hypothetical protein [Alphaproteobacteria bacterium]
MGHKLYKGVAYGMGVAFIAPILFGALERLVKSATAAARRPGSSPERVGEDESREEPLPPK